MQLHINTNTLLNELDTLAHFSASPAPGVTRVLWSEPDLQARTMLREWCGAAGLELREDALGTLFARWPGSEPALPPVATGSHTDAIPDAGRYDGTVGVLGALEALRALKRAGYQPRRSLELVVFTAEEPTRFGIGCLGSRAMAGSLSVEQLLALRDQHGQGVEELRALAGHRGALADVRLQPGAFHAFVELHIEQGPLLERANQQIGVVTRIAAPASLRVTLTGEGGHAGAVLMPDRHDALLAGAEIALAVERAALESTSRDAVATTGVLRIEPGAINSIPSRAVLEIDIRDTQLAAREQARAAVEQAVHVICEQRKIDYTLQTLNADPPATCSPELVAAVESVCHELGLRQRPMVSRAYHDTLFMASLCPVTMIFIPCHNGVSHRPDEYSSPEQIATGVMVLAHTLARLCS